MQNCRIGRTESMNRKYQTRKRKPDMGNRAIPIRHGQCRRRVVRSTIREEKGRKSSPSNCQCFDERGENLDKLTKGSPGAIAFQKRKSDLQTDKIEAPLFPYEDLPKQSLLVRGAESGSTSWVEIVNELEPVRLRIYSDGAFELWRKSKTKREVLCCSGNITLPECAKQSDFSWNVPAGEKNVSCNSVTLKWSTDVRLEVHLTQDYKSDWNKGLMNGFVLDKYISSDNAEMAEIKINMTSAGKWFGGAHFMKQCWPLNKASWEVGPYYPFDHGPNGLNTLVASQWVTSKGLLVMMDPDTPFLHVGMNAPDYGPRGKRTHRKWGTGVQNATKVVLPLTTKESKFSNHDDILRLQSRKDYRDDRVLHPHCDWIPKTGNRVASEHGHDMCISVALCAFPNILEAAMSALQTLPRPKVMPALKVLRDPIWTTWAKYKQFVNQKKVLSYAKEIKESGLNFSVMEIDDRWQIQYGDLEFDPKKFPDPKAMVDELHAMGFKVTLWVMPFVEKKSAAFKEGMQNGYFVHRKGTSSNSHLPGFFNWWNIPPVVALDVTNPEAVEWFVSRLTKLQTTCGIDGFKFDAGEPCFLPKNMVTHSPLSHPSEYTKLWINEVAGRFQGGVSEVRTGHRTQDVGMMTRIGDRFSTWDISNGLQSIIPTVLTSGLLGYPFALPDIIGGNAYFGRNPDTELFVRWTQVNALMPAMQFSIAPWHIGRDVENLCSHAFKLRKDLEDHMLDLADDAVKALKPMIRPMWWLDPEDEITYDIFDQYALGNDIIVAPVVVKGQRQRNVYLTDGIWEDMSQPGTTFTGGQWLMDIEAPLSRLPCFKRIKEGEKYMDSDSYSEE